MQNLGVNYEDVKYRVLDDLKGKNWLATFGMLMLFGMLGGHRFYTGKTGSAIAMLILTICIITLPISLIWWYIDLFAMAMGVFKHADGSKLYEQVNWLAWLEVVGVSLCVISYIGLLVAGIVGLAGGGHAPIAP